MVNKLCGWEWADIKEAMCSLGAKQRWATEASDLLSELKAWHVTCHDQSPGTLNH